MTTLINTQTPGLLNATVATRGKRSKFKVGDRVFYALNAGAHWAVQGPVKVTGIRGNGDLFLSDHWACRVKPQHVHHAAEAAAAQVLKLNQHTKG
ncbi:MAG: hypothetical protein ICCCNLDF_02836 [Planctomycetes bacterium]|nr:hypothetical protein [Planctomycetota bacterium]